MIFVRELRNRHGIGFRAIYQRFAQDLLLDGARVDVGEVHAQQVTDPEWISREVLHAGFSYPIPETQDQLARDVRPNLPWAEDHFQERVGGEPLNPPPSAESWPYAQRGHEDHLIDGKFSHTYLERFWPKRAPGRADEYAEENENRKGIRFPYGDYADLLAVLWKNPLTRQAYLPIWFPEDIDAARRGQRVPCTLGYHFLMRNNRLNVTYFIRSCDLVRFFRDDVYMACRLAQHTLEKLRANSWNKEKFRWDEVVVGNLDMHIVSLHCFEGDVPALRREAMFREATRT